jgi:uncharacterized membrane protein (DUF2068 family)
MESKARVFFWVSFIFLPFVYYSVIKSVGWWRVFVASIGFLLLVWLVLLFNGFSGWLFPCLCCWVKLALR